MWAERFTCDYAAQTPSLVLGYDSMRLCVTSLKLKNFAKTDVHADHSKLSLSVNVAMVDTVFTNTFTSERACKS